MNRPVHWLGVLLSSLYCATALAAAPAPKPAGDAHASAASVRELLDTMQMQKMLDSVQAQVDASLEAGMKAGLGDTKLSPKQEQIVGDMRKQLGALFREELSWERFSPIIVDTYQETFSQKEVDGMLVFYRSPTGQAVISKLPRAMEKTMKHTQEMVADMNPKMRKIVNDALAAIKADAEERAKDGTP